MSDALGCVQEGVDVEFGAALAARSAALGAAGDGLGLGPPDLCYLHKSYKSALGLGGLKLLGGALQVGEDQPAVGFYHHVIGLDTSSPATISAYFAELSVAQQSGTWYAGGKWQIVGGVFCCYESFSRVDLRVHVSIPGGVRATLLHCATGQVTEKVAPAVWQHASMSGLFRALCAPPAMHCMRLLPPPLTPEDEPAFLESAQHLMRAAVDGDPAADGAGGAGGALLLCELLGTLLWRYFEQSRRFEAAVAFFGPLQDAVPSCGAHVAAAQRQLGSQ